nr:defensin-like protein 183 [Ipomoea batatas]
MGSKIVLMFSLAFLLIMLDSTTLNAESHNPNCMPENQICKNGNCECRRIVEDNVVVNGITILDCQSQEACKQFCLDPTCKYACIAGTCNMAAGSGEWLPAAGPPVERKGSEVVIGMDARINEPDCVANLGPCSIASCDEACCDRMCNNYYSGLHPYARCTPIPGTGLSLCDCWHDCY